MDELDISWFKNQEIIEKKYDDFYKINFSYLSIKFLYVKNDELIYIKKIKYNLNSNILTKNELINIFSKNRVLNNEMYSLFGLLKYNITISPEEILKCKDIYNNNYTEILTHVDDIYFEKSIKYLSSINELFIILKPKSILNLTKKIKITNKKTKRKPIV
tara:strand:+ start:18762 stop:19241 length:480 start_codon:yes stop_codon:yes gene_type:complete